MGADKPTNPEQTALSALNNSGLAALIQQAEQLAELDQSLRRNLPVALAQNCRLAHWDAGKLVFHVSNPVWKNKLRLHSQEILGYARALGLHAQEVRIKVDVGFKPTEQP